MLKSFDAVIIGAPMILGGHRNAVRFVKKHQKMLSRLPVAYFATAMSLTQPEPGTEQPTQLYLDPTLSTPPKNPQRLSLKERYASVSNYLRPMLGAAAPVKPVNVAFFGGKLEIFRLKWWQALFVIIFVQAQPGDSRNWSSIEEWGKQLDTLFAGKIT